MSRFTGARERICTIRKKAGRQFTPGLDGPVDKDPIRSRRTVQAIKVAFGSWSNFCGHRDDEWTSRKDRRDFIKAYNRPASAEVAQ